MADGHDAAPVQQEGPASAAPPPLPPVAPPPPDPDPSTSLLIPSLASHRSLVILYGSQSGCASELAHRLSLDAFQRGFHPILVLPCDAFPLHLLPSTPLLLLVTSTQGAGEPPSNAASFYRNLLRRSLPPSSLSSLHFSAFGLGDSSYPIYNAVARRLYQRLLDLGGVSVCRRGLGDDQHDRGYEAGWEEWRTELWVSLRQRLAWMAGQREEHVDTALQPPFPFSLTLLDTHESASLPSSSPLLSSALSPWCDATAALPLPSPSAHPVVLPPVSLPPWGVGPSRFSPYPALLTHNCRLTPATHFQDVRHLRFLLPPTPAFLPGDVVDIFPRNDPAVARAFLAAVGLPPATVVATTPVSPGHGAQEWEELDGVGGVELPPRCTLQELCEVHLDVAGTPKRSFFAFLALHASDPLQREKLLDLSSTDGQRDLYRYCHKEKRTYVEVLEDFPSARPPLAELVARVPRLGPRSFSISSAHALYPGEVQVTAALLTFTTPWKRKRMGVCSTFLSLLPQSKGDEPLATTVYVSVYVRRGGFTLPKTVGWGGPPLLMIGPGTGVAPLRALCQAKLAALSSVPSPAPTFSPYLLVFGNRNRDADFLYEEEWARYHEKGVLERPVVTAFSRDQVEKVYVQDRLQEDGVREQVFDWLHEQRGVVIVAGSSGAMPREVRRALTRIFQVEGGMEVAEAQAYLRSMEKERRYIQETW